MNSKPAKESLEPKAGGAAAREDPKNVQNAQSEVKLESIDGSLLVRSNPAVSSSKAESEPKNLWDEAYTTLKKEHPKLIDNYEMDLLASQNSNQQGMLVRIGFLGLKGIRYHSRLLVELLSVTLVWIHLTHEH